MSFSGAISERSWLSLFKTFSKQDRLRTGWNYKYIRLIFPMTLVPTRTCQLHGGRSFILLYAVRRLCPWIQICRMTSPLLQRCLQVEHKGRWLRTSSLVISRSTIKTNLISFTHHRLDLKPKPASILMSGHSHNEVPCFEQLLAVKLTPDPKRSLYICANRKRFYKNDRFSVSLQKLPNSRCHALCL